MRAGGSSRRSLLFVGIIIGICSVQHAAAARGSSSSSRLLQQVETMGHKSSMAKKTKPLALSEVMAVAASTGALLPACVPKYVTDLVIPPPMPVTTQPLTEVSLATLLAPAR